MAYELIPFHLEIINKNLPPRFAVLKDRYPSTIFNAADHWDKPKFPSGYVPKQIEIYYKESAHSPAISYTEGKIKYVLEEIPVDPDVTLVMVEAIWTYICVQGQVILDKTEGIQFPPELINHELMLRRLVNSLSLDKFKDLSG